MSFTKTEEYNFRSAALYGFTVDSLQTLVDELRAAGIHGSNVVKFEIDSRNGSQDRAVVKVAKLNQDEQPEVKINVTQIKDDINIEEIFKKLENWTQLGKKFLG